MGWRLGAGIHYGLSRLGETKGSPPFVLFTTHGMTGSMSRRGNCWGNACVESVFGTLKRELIYHRQYCTRNEATGDIFEYIEVFYHRLRRHSTLDYDSPAEFEAKTAVA
jgi:putative transposase